jgi:hypothetical protein
MQKLILSLLCLAGLAASAQTITVITPARRTPIPNGFIYSAGVCLTTPVNGSYLVQVATSPAGPWQDRLTFRAVGEPVSCRVVSLTQAETNRFYLRAARL